MSIYSNTFLEYMIRQGRQAFVQPPYIEGITLNQYGWVDCPTTGELVLPIYEILPTEEKTMYWFSEKIVCNSSTPVRMSLEGNFNYIDGVGFDPNGWKVINGYMVSDMRGHEWNGIAPIKTVRGEALRLRVYGATGNNNDFYFKWIGVELTEGE
jgi:hypothetical protein